MKRHMKFFLSVYNLSLTCVFLMLLMIAEGLMLKFLLEDPKDSVMIFAFWYITAHILVLLAVIFGNGYEYLGTVEILHDRLVFRSPLRRARVFYYTEIVDIGIDYGVITGLRHFYIFVSKTKIPREFTHRITRLRFTKATMRIQYRRKVFNALLEALPWDNLGKTLSRNESVVHLFHLDDQ